ncbi:roundabout homolog 2-like isoform X2 [Haliotis rufescens]|uniref:roundabout homolog 2-like isoform X2 n=1 Tax=Haliotis rufescens TaxID=6454 RepID=UPI001EB045FF|nr:roundabout homolog 2-like isoform X2 [Haliotis rufescens]
MMMNYLNRGCVGSVYMTGVLTVIIFVISGHALGDPSNPRIVEHPDDDYVAKNEPATLNCKAEGIPPPKITWYRNGRRVVTSPENPSSHRMLLNNGQLFFLRVIHNKNYKPDVGVYYCNATNIHGSAISRNATLEIAVLRDEFREVPSSATVATGETATFHCKPPKGEPEPKVLWQRNEDPLTIDGRISMNNNGDLVIENVQVTDGGEYTCLALNKGGEKLSPRARLTVLEKPKIRQLPDDIQANEGDTVELKCQAIGDPEPTVTWKKQDGRISYGRARQLNDGTLRIEKVQAEDDGQYICVAENLAGTVEAAGRLSIQTHPSFLIKPLDQVVGQGRTITLQCVVTGNPSPTVFWSKGAEQPLMFPNQKNGRFSVAEDGTFRIERVQFEDEGEYVCQALNVIGSAKATARIDVRQQDSRPPPIIKLGPQNQTLPPDEMAMLPCQATGNPQPTIRWYRKDRPILGTNARLVILDSGTLQISDVRASDSDTYTCKAVSETGETAWSAYLKITGRGPYRRTQKSQTFPGRPLKPVATDITDTTVHLTWQPNTKKKGDSPTYAFIVEYFSHETEKGWVVASNSITHESFTVHGLEPETHYVFLVRAENSHGISQPSEISDSVVTRERRKPNKKINLPKSVIREKLEGMVVEIMKGEAINATVIKVTWRVLKGRDAIGGFVIEYKKITDLRRMTYGTVITKKVLDPYSTSYMLYNLHSYAWYEICIKAYGGEVKSQCSSPVKVPTKESVPSAPPENIIIHKEQETVIHIRWSPPPKPKRNGDIQGYDIYCMDNDRKHNCSLSTNDTTSSALVRNIDADLTYRIRLAAKTSKGLGVWSKTFVVGPEQPNIMKEPWFIGMLISTIGGTLWLALCIFSVWLCRKRKNRKKLAQNGMYSAVPVHKSDESARGGNVLSRDDVVYAQKDGNMHSNLSGYGVLQSDLASLLDSGNKDVELKDQNIYNSAGLMPQMKTFYQKPNSVPVSVAPYATTTLINTSNQTGRPIQTSGMESAFRPINHAYVHSSASGSGDSCQKPELRTSDSNTDNSRPNTGCTHDEIQCLASPGSDSGSLTTDEYGMPVKRTKKGAKPCCQGKQAMVNWAELLPPPPEHPPPSDIGTPPESPMNTLNRMERQRQMNNRSPLSPVSKISACSCPVPHDRMPANIRCVPYSDTEFGTQPRMHDCRPYSPKQLNNNRQRTQSPTHDGRGQSPRGFMYPPCHGAPNDCHIYLQRPYHSDAERTHMPMQAYGPTSLHGYKIKQMENDLRHLSDPEQGPLPPSRMCSHSLSSGENPLMDRACQSSLPSLASECMHSPVCHGRNADSPTSEDLQDYAGESDMEGNRLTDCPTPDSSMNGEGDGSVSGSILASWASVTDQSNTSCSSLRSSAASSSEGSFLAAETDFATAVARAAELSGMTVVGTTVSDPKNGKKYRKHHRQQRPTSPYSTDSNYSAVVHKPYPRSQRKKQLVDQAKKYGCRGRPDQMDSCMSYAPCDSQNGVADLPMYYRPNFPMPAALPTSPCGSTRSSLSGKSQAGYMSPGMANNGHIYCTIPALPPPQDPMYGSQDGCVYGIPMQPSNSNLYQSGSDIPIA